MLTFNRRSPPVSLDATGASGPSDATLQATLRGTVFYRVLTLYRGQVGGFDAAMLPLIAASTVPAVGEDRVRRYVITAHEVAGDDVAAGLDAL